jgi:hypothetical protein
MLEAEGMFDRVAEFPSCFLSPGVDTQADQSEDCDSISFALQLDFACAREILGPLLRLMVIESGVE